MVQLNVRTLQRFMRYSALHTCPRSHNPSSRDQTSSHNERNDSERRKYLYMVHVRNLKLAKKKPKKSQPNQGDDEDPFDVTSSSSIKLTTLVFDNAFRRAAPVSSTECKNRSSSRHSCQSFPSIALFNSRTASSLFSSSCSRLWSTRRYDPAVLSR